MEKRLINSNVSIKRDKTKTKQQSDTLNLTEISKTKSSNPASKSNSKKPKIKTSTSIKQEEYRSRVIPPRRLKITESDMYLVRRDAIPKKLLQVLKAKEAIYRGEAITIKDALEEFDVNFSYYQRYKNAIIPFYEATNEKIFTLVFETEGQENTISDIVALISKHLGKILTVNQGFPINDIMSINISFDTTPMKINPYDLFSKLRNIKGVRYMEIMGRINNTSINKSKSKKN
ncbi:MAG: hypothetical protein IJ862_07345 [Selenomonadaceae bacterium]|nr:hypothetical protein [Selenomonadaceae bacterium]